MNAISKTDKASKTTKTTKVLPKLEISPEHNLTRYLQDIRKFPMLTLELEQQLSNDWAKNGAEDAAHQLVTSHLPLDRKSVE